MKFQLRQVDLMNRDSLYYLERLDAFDIMETHIMDRVMQDYWQGNLDAGGSFFEVSTCFGILFRADSKLTKNKQRDFEHLHRFYRKRSDLEIV